MARGAQQPDFPAFLYLIVVQADDCSRSRAGAAALPAVLWLSVVVLGLLPTHTHPQRLSQAASAPGTEIQSGLPILDDATLRQEYEAYRASVQGMRVYRVSYIRVPSEELARDLIARIRSGADFSTLARKHSTHAESSANGGALGSHAGCRWARSTLQVLDLLQVGQTWTRPLKGTHGWGIYRLDAVAPVEPRGFDGYKRELLSGRFEPECPWVPPVTVAPAPAAVAPDAGRK